MFKNLKFLNEIWANRQMIREVLNILKIVLTHANNLFEDLADDGKLNGSNKK